MPQLLMVTLNYVSIVGSFQIDVIEVFVDISLSNFNKLHTPSENMAVSAAPDLDLRGPEGA